MALTLQKGDRGPDVSRLQQLLNKKLKPSPKLSLDDDFGGRTHDAVVRFQKEWGLEPDGKVGSKTWTALRQKMVAATPEATTTEPKKTWMEIAKAELGIHENSLPGEDESRIVEYHSATTLHATNDETPWCSSFVNWVMKEAGHVGTGSALAKSWVNWGSGLVTPEYGAVTVIKKKTSGSDAATGSSTGFHVAFYVSGGSTHVRLLGGNQADSVKYSNFSLGAYDVKAYRWPG